MRFIHHIDTTWQKAFDVKDTCYLRTDSHDPRVVEIVSADQDGRIETHAVIYLAPGQSIRKEEN